ncbi:5-carboxymethyl-2-hydroxymuconate Delta-isomerase [Caenispirillum salinarum]|uniref:5-carboxymethyl-2-hydroxymuconate Delta-isomerase n=1 Tax=Caenispirillum salinarum TaxID=859058 RepID=UPI0038500ABC
MPQIRIEHSANLAGAFEPAQLALSVHRLCVEHAKATMDACKSRILNVGDVVVADGAAEGFMMHVEIGLLKGRTPEAKGALAEAVLARLAGAVEGKPGINLSVEVRDMDTDTYRKQVTS